MQLTGEADFRQMKTGTLFSGYMGLYWLLIVSSCRTAQPAPERVSGWAVPATAGIKNCYRLNDSIYRSAQPGATARAALGQLNIKAVLNLRSSHRDPDFGRSTVIQHYRVPMRAKEIQDAEIIKALRIIRESPKPLLVHCRYGADRTGLVIALYRVIFCEWSKQEAIEEMEKGGYHFHTRYDNIPAYIQQADITALRKAIFE